MPRHRKSPPITDPNIDPRPPPPLLNSSTLPKPPSRQASFKSSRANYLGTSRGTRQLRPNLRNTSTSPAAPTSHSRRDRLLPTSAMPYLSTSQAYLEQSAQLLEAYPETVSKARTIIPRTPHSHTWLATVSSHFDTVNPEQRGLRTRRHNPLPCCSRATCPSRIRSKQKETKNENQKKQHQSNKLTTLRP